MKIAKACWICAVGLVSGCSSLPPALDPAGYAQDRITTSIDDAQTDVAFLDNYKPQQAGRTSLVPRGPDQTLLALPGLWEGEYWSYCLHAGVRRPGEGDGYAYAPLKGPDAQVIRHILQNQLAHPEIEQYKIQMLIWAILARTRLADTSPGIRATAKALLSQEEIDRLNGGALGKIPPELLEQIIAMLPAELRRAAKVNADLRGLLANPANASYAEIERIAAPLGDLPAPGGSRQIPSGRWSYDDSQRVFVRYFPNGYSLTRMQFYAAEKFTVERDPSGRISAIGDGGGARVEITYQPGNGAVSIDGDPGVHVSAFASIRLTAPDPERPWETRTFSLEGSGWALTGMPNGNGKATGADAAAMQQRYDGALDLERQVKKLAAAVHKRDKDQALDEESLVELGEYAVAMQAVYDAQRQGAPWVTRAADLFYRAWMSDAASGSRATKGSFAAHASPPQLAMFDPSGSAAQPGKAGMQRLAQSPRDNQCEGFETQKKLVEFYTKFLSWGATAYEILKERKLPPSWLQEKSYEQFQLDADIDRGFRMTKALAGCPSSASAHLNMAPQVNGPLVVPAQPPSAQSAQSAKAFHELAGAWQRLSSQLQKAVASQEQYRSALAAGDKVAAGARARELTGNLRASGVEMLQASARLSALSTQLRSEHWDVPLTLEGIRKYQENLKANGFPKDVLDAVKKHGMSDEDIQAVYTRRLQPLADWQDTTQLRLFDDAAAALQELGRLYAALPAVS
jgi:hypothetical protein